MPNMASGSWIDVNDGCPIGCRLDGDDQASVVIGSMPSEHELTFDAASLRRLVEATTETLAQMADEADA